MIIVNIAFAQEKQKSKLDEFYDNIYKKNDKAKTLEQSNLEHHYNIQKLSKEEAFKILKTYIKITKDNIEINNQPSYRDYNDEPQETEIKRTPK